MFPAEKLEKGGFNKYVLATLVHKVPTELDGGKGTVLFSYFIYPI